MNAAPPLETTPQKRLEGNVVSYLRTVFAGPGVSLVVLGTEDPLQIPGSKTRFVVEVDVSDTAEASVPMNFQMRSTLTFRLTSHPTVVDAALHQEIFQRLRQSIFDDPPQYVPGQPMIVATRTLLNAVNRVPGALTQRAFDRVHLYDVEPAGEATGNSDDGLMASVLEVTAIFGGWDWEAATPYP